VSAVILRRVTLSAGAAIPALVALSQFAAVVLVFPHMHGDRLVFPIYLLLVPYAATAATLALRRASEVHGLPRLRVRSLWPYFGFAIVSGVAAMPLSAAGPIEALRLDLWLVAIVWAAGALTFRMSDRAVWVVFGAAAAAAVVQASGSVAAAGGAPQLLYAGNGLEMRLAETGTAGAVAYLVLWARVLFVTLRAAMSRERPALMLGIHMALIASFALELTAGFTGHGSTRWVWVLMIGLLFGTAEGRHQAEQMGRSEVAVRRHARIQRETTGGEFEHLY